MVKDIMCGDEAAAARSMLQITYPVIMTDIIWTRKRPLLTVFGTRWKMVLLRDGTTWSIYGITHLTKR